MSDVVIFFLFHLFNAFLGALVFYLIHRNDNK